MAKETVGLGTLANDGTGDTLRSGGTKINSNFSLLNFLIKLDSSMKDSFLL